MFFNRFCPVGYLAVEYGLSSGKTLTECEDFVKQSLKSRGFGPEMESRQV
jgi:hypothetical protein